MDISHYHYELPEERIAKFPLERGKERLLVLERFSGKISHLFFQDIKSLFRSGDLLVLNDTRVIPARIMGRKESGGKVELLLIRKIDPETWLCLLKASKGFKNGTQIIIGQNQTAIVKNKDGDFYRVVFTDPDHVLQAGSIPLPPYLNREPEEADASTYQTVYARHDGSVAAPTAGLHFTRDLLDELNAAGIETVTVTLHVGPGTFIPVRTQTIEEHIMHEEEYSVTGEAAEAINKAMEQGRRVVAVGTTTVRVLEHLMKDHGMIKAGSGETNLFIYNGFPYRCVNVLLTNFHLPCSTLLMLVSAFGGYELVMKAYREAIERKYRFFSYGDAMLII